MTASSEQLEDRKKQMFGRIVIICLLLTLFLLTIAEAQHSKKIPRIAYLTVAPLSANVARVEAFRQGLRELGYFEGKNIVIEWRSGEGKLKRERELVAEALELKVDVIVTSGPTMTRAAKQATAIIPIVMTFDSDPVGSRFIASLARPGGNITGLSALTPELSGKQLELLKEIIPKISRVAVLGNSNEPANPKTLKEMELAAGVLGIRVLSLDVLASGDIEPAFEGATKARADALVVLPSLVLSDQRAKVANLANEKSNPGDILQGRIRRTRRAYELRNEFHRLGPARCHLRRQNSQRRQARRSSRRAADQV
jgi:putative ABC transport system substrate-binding protein